MGILDLFKLKSHTAPVSDADEGELTYQDENATERWYAHRLYNYKPDLAQFGFKLDKPSSHDPQIAERLIRYYRGLIAEMAARNIALGADMWANITKGHALLGRALEEGDGARVLALLQQVATGTLVSGFMNVQSYARLQKRREARQIEAKWFVDKLLSLSEAFGCFPIHGVEQGSYDFEEIDLQQRLSAVQKKLPFSLAPPSAGGGSFGYKSDENILNVKDIYAIYTAEQVRRFVLDQKTPHIAEIGGGTGTLAYYLVRAGIPKVSLFDLPTVSIIQAYYLMRSITPTSVWLYGEDASDKESTARVLPFWALDNEPDKSIAMFVNQDSLPEMERKIALNYMELFKRKGSALFSINQEGQAQDGLGNAQSVVFELTETTGGFSRFQRSLHWMRTGYIEELYRMQA